MRWVGFGVLGLDLVLEMAGRSGVGKAEGRWAHKRWDMPRLLRRLTTAVRPTRRRNEELRENKAPPDGNRLVTRLQR